MLGHELPQRVERAIDSSRWRTPVDVREATLVHIVSSEHVDDTHGFARIRGRKAKSAKWNPREYLALRLAIRDFVTLLQWFDLESHLIFIVMVFSYLATAVYLDRVFSVVTRQLDHVGVVRHLATTFTTRTSDVHGIANESGAVLT